MLSRDSIDRKGAMNISVLLWDVLLTLSSFNSYFFEHGKYSCFMSAHSIISRVTIRFLSILIALATSHARCLIFYGLLGSLIVC